MLQTRKGVLADPSCELVQIDFAGSEALQGGDRLDLLRLEAETVDEQKRTKCQQRYALVAIEESMIPSQPERILRRQLKQVRRVSVRKKLPRASKSAYLQMGVAQPASSSEKPE